MNKDLQSTVVMEVPVSINLAPNAAKPDTVDTNSSDGEFEELIGNYRQLIRKRTIPYPVAYRFKKELGHGRQGVVFLAERQGARGCLTRHAIKLFDPGIYSSAPVYLTDMGRIAQQISTLQPINTPNLVSCDFYEECNGIGYAHMEAIDGLDIQYLIDGKHTEIARSRSTDEEWDHFMKVFFKVENNRLSLHPGLAVYLIRNVLRGLTVLHEHGFIHGDIKPTNIMIDVQGRVKLVDFGRAVRIGEKVNILLGSPLFMAPEVHRREPGCLQSDLFSTGLVGLEMLSGNRITVMADYNENELIDFKTTLARRIEDWLPLSVLNNVELTNVFRWLLEPELANRFVTAKEAESGALSFASARLWLHDYERETEYERELENYLRKLVDEETGMLNPHFGSDNLTAIIIT